MNIFIDTSALLAVLDRSDEHHSAAKRAWTGFLTADAIFVCHNYILVETHAVLTRRIGMDAVRVFEQDVRPVLSLIWATPEIHEAAVGAYLAAGRRSLSLVDCVSFEIMRRTGLRIAFAFDPHFSEFGYQTTPA